MRFISYLVYCRKCHPVCRGDVSRVAGQVDVPSVPDLGQAGLGHGVQQARVDSLPRDAAVNHHLASCGLPAGEGGLDEGEEVARPGKEDAGNLGPVGKDQLGQETLLETTASAVVVVVP